MNEHHHETLFGMRAGLLLTILLLALPAGAQSPEGERGTFALVDCRIETVTNGVIASGTIVISDGLIESVSADDVVPSGARLVSCEGGTVYPGLIDAGSKIGLMEIGSLAETRDFAEVGAITPQMQAITAVYPSSIHIPIARVHGITTSLATPSGGLMPGTAALLSLHGYSPSHMDLGFRGVVVNFPSAAPRGRFDQRSEEDRERQARQARERLDEVWENAVLFTRIEEAEPDPEIIREYSPEMEALLPVVRGEAPLLIEANHADDILSVLEWLEEKEVRAVLMGANEGWRVADRIAAAGLPVLVGPVVALPTRESDRYDRVYTNPGLLHAAGVQVALRTTSLGQNDTHNTRNLPFHAAFAVAFGQEHGFDRQRALESVTIVPARIFGVDDQLGSIEAGKRATLFVADGDPFETATQVTRLFIDGYDVPLTSRQRELYREYLDRSPAVAK